MSNIDDGGVGEGRFHFTRENNQRGQSALRIEPRKMLGAQNGGLPSDCPVACSVNPLFTIRADVEIPDGLKALDNPDKILLSWRFWPFAHPREGRMTMFVHLDERGKAIRLLMTEIGRQRFVGLLACPRTRGQGEAF